MKLPYFLALFQGQDLIINAKVGRLSAKPKMPFGYMEIIWIQCEDKEWLINLDQQTIEFKNGANNFYRQAKINRKIHPICASNNRTDHTKYFINTIFGDIVIISYKRQLCPYFNKEFFKKYGDFNDCVGALISKNKLKYIDNLYSVII